MVGSLNGSSANGVCPCPTLRAATAADSSNGRPIWRALFAPGGRRRWQLMYRHRALTYRIVEHLGRWGMLDVLLVAVMVAFIKLGGLVELMNPLSPWQVPARTNRTGLPERR